MNTACESVSVSTRAKVFALCLFALLALAAYANVLDTYFLSDDFAQLGRVLTGDFSVTWGREHGGFFRPLFVLSLLIDAAVWEREPLGFHLTNTILHGLNSFLVFLLASPLTKGAGFDPAARRWLAWGGGLIFLLHPSHTEAVTWVSGRPDLLATFFSLLALLSFYSDRRTARRARLALALFCFALALLSKESAACLPVVIFLLGLYAAPREGGGAFSRSLKEAAPFALLLAVYVAVRALALGALVGGYGAGQHLNFTHSMIVSQLLRFPLRALFHASALRSFPFLESRALSPALIVIGCVVVIALAVTFARAGGRTSVLKFLRGNKFLWLLLALFLTALLPVINLRIEVFTTQGERFLYFPSVFFALALAHLLIKNARGRVAAARPVVLCAVLVFYAFGLRQTNEHWRETARLSRSVLDRVVRLSDQDEILFVNLPDNFLGAHLFRNGLPEALRTFQNAKRFRNVHILAWHNLRSTRDTAELTADGDGVFTLRLPGVGTAFERFNDPPEAVEFLERSEKLLRFRLRDDAASRLDLFYLSGGEVIPVNLNPELRLPD